MHILFIGYGKTSRRVAKLLFQAGHQITTISQSPKTDSWATHLIQDVHQLDLKHVAPIDWVYILLSPQQSNVEGYRQTYLRSVPSIVQALRNHPVQKIVLVSSTRVYGENQGQYIDDDSAIQPSDEQGLILTEMELAWQQAYPGKCVVIRPSGIYGTSIARMTKLAEQTHTYPAIHWTNRIHIDDLASFLASLPDYAQLEESYIVSNTQHLPMHEILLWFQQQLGLPPLQLLSQQQIGKRLRASRLQALGFELQHDDCFIDYAKSLQSLKQ